MGANFLAALVITQAVFNLDINPFIFSIPVILGGLVLAGAALIILARSGLPLGEENGVILSSPDSASPARFPITVNLAAGTGRDHLPGDSGRGSLLFPHASSSRPPHSAAGSMG
jgi:hypothetical protein